MLLTRRKATEMKCSRCSKAIRRFPFTCPSCKIVLCWKCWGEHLDAKVCAYSKLKKIDV